MAEILFLSGLCLGAFAFATLLSYALAWGIRYARGQAVPEPGATLRISSGQSVYRVKFLGPTPEGWAFQPPLQGNAPVPIRVGDTLLVEAPCRGGALRFRTSLVWRSADPMMMVMEPPTDRRLIERRGGKRLTPIGEMGVMLEGALSRLMDIGPNGARVRTNARLRRGERVLLAGAWTPEPWGGHVLDVSDSGEAEFRREVRLVFEETQELDAMRKSCSAG